MVQVIEQLGSVAGRIGKGFAKSLSDNIPKEVERTRLSSGISNLGKQDLSGKNRLELMGEILRVPGMTPELAPLALQQIQNQNFANRSKNGSPVPKGNISQEIPQNPSAQNFPNTQQASPQVQENGFASPEQISAYKANQLRPATTQKRDELAAKYMEEGIATSIPEAIAYADNEIKKDKDVQEEENLKLKKDFNDRMALSLQGGGLGHYKDVAGDIQKRLVDQGEYMVNVLGMTPQQAAEKLEGITLELGKSANNLRETSSFANMFRSSAKKTQELKQQKEEFEKYGFGEEFDDMVTGEMGTTPLQTAHLLDPLKNKAVIDQIGKLKDLRRWDAEAKLKDKQLDKIIKSISPKDNLFSIEYELRNKGYDVNQFKQRVSELQSKKEIALTPQQKRQQKRAVSNTFLGDLLYQIF